MSKAWATFARTGNPNHKGVPRWSKYTTEKRSTMLFNNECIMENDPGKVERKAWDGII
jgi:para-nitrobenzyl esterase